MNYFWICDQRDHENQPPRNAGHAVSELAGERHPHSKWLDRMQNPVHNAVLTNGRWRNLHRKTQREQRIGLQKGAIRIGYLVGFTVEQIEAVELKAPPIVESVAQLSIQQTGRR